MPRNPLVVVQIAFSLALLTAAALFIRGAGKAATVDTGLQTSSNYLVEVDASLATYDQTRSQDLYRTLEERLAALPGVEQRQHFLHGSVRNGRARQIGPTRREPIPHRTRSPPPPRKVSRLVPNWNSVGADYFKTVGLPLLRGRAFKMAEAMHQTSPKVAIIDEVLAKKLWPDGDALGQRIQFAEKDPTQAKGGEKTRAQIEIVGIVPFTRNDLFEKDPNGTLYLPFAGGFQSNVFFHLKFAPNAGHDAGATADLIRRTVREVDPAVPILSFENVRATSRWQYRALDRAGGRGVVQHVWRSGIGARDSRRVWRQGLLGRASHPGDRDSHGARRTPRDGAMDDPARGHRDVGERSVARLAAGRGDRQTH